MILLTLDLVDSKISTTHQGKQGSSVLSILLEGWLGEIIVSSWVDLLPIESRREVGKLVKILRWVDDWDLGIISHGSLFKIPNEEFNNMRPEVF